MRSFVNNYDILIYSIGASDEEHGPALPRQIDDYMATRIAVELSIKLCVIYKGHLPYCGDKIGELAKQWCLAYMDQDYVVKNIKQDLERDILIYNKYLKRKISHIIVISGHGGNNFLGTKESFFSKELGIQFLYIPPFEGVSVIDDKLGEIRVDHASIGEHSIAAYLGLLDGEKLDYMNKLASKDPEDVLRKWPTVAGLGGYRLYGGPEYDVLRNSKPDSMNAAKRFIKERKMVADIEIGRQLYDKNIDVAKDKILSFLDQTQKQV